MTSELEQAFRKLLRNVRLPRDHAGHLAAFWDSAERVHLQSGAVLLRQGDRGDAMLLVLEGQVAVTFTRQNGDLVELARLRAPLLLGATGAVDGEARTASCVLSTPGTVLRMRRGVFLDALQRTGPEAEVMRELLLFSMHNQLLSANRGLREALAASSRS
jgi:CRP-like cAMP-binding protein